MVDVQPSDWIALAAIGATVAAAWIVHLDRVSDRAHVEKLTHEQREQDRRATTYRDLLVMILQVEQAIRTTLPIWSRAGDEPYPGPTQDAQRVMQASVAAYGSPKIGNMYEAASVVSREFLEAVALVRGAELSQASDGGSARKLVEAKRRAFIEARKGLEKQVRTELAQ
jgi:hypothetical protein